MIHTIKDLKEIIKDLPDEMEIDGYNGDGESYKVSHWTVKKDSNDEDDISLLEDHPEGLLTFSID